MIAILEEEARYLTDKASLLEQNIKNIENTLSGPN